MRQKLTAMEKVLASAKALNEVVAGNLSAEDIAQYLRARLGLGWSLITAAQYLTGKSAMEAIDSLPSDFSHDGLTKDEIAAAVFSAHSICANASPSGNSMSSGFAVSSFKT